MRSLTASALSALLALAAACDKEETEKPDSETSEAETPRAENRTAEDPPTPQLQGAIELPAAVPSDAIAVFSIRVPESVFQSIIAADPMGLATDGMKELETDLDAFFGRTVGIQILDAKSVTGFAQSEKELGAIIEGVSGGIKAEKVGDHAGVALYGEPGEPIRMAQIEDTLLVGTEGAVEAAIDASKDEAESAAGGELAAFVTAHSEGAAMVAAADMKRLPGDLAREIPPNLTVDRGLFTFGSDGLAVRLEGGKEEIEALSALITSGLEMASAEAEKQRERAMKREDDVVEGAAMIISAHYMRSAKTAFAPKVEDGALTMSVPVKAGDPAILAAVAGIGAAIAIPAFTKYMRRSKTSEARVQLAKMFDAASAYFHEEHVDADALDAAPHKCPNDGNLRGESGITPPLSVDCSAGPGGRCVPSFGDETGEGYYDVSLWTKNPVWNGLNFQQEQGHYFHYNFIWANDPEGFGTCQFTAQAFGDLDGDGVFSTYERTGAGDRLGVNSAAGLYIDNELE